MGLDPKPRFDKAFWKGVTNMGTPMDIREKIARVFYNFDDRPFFETENYGIQIDQILAIIEEAGYVKLADEQSLPLPSNNIKGEAREGYYLGQQSLTNTNWRKVEVKDGS